MHPLIGFCSFGQETSSCSRGLCSGWRPELIDLQGIRPDAIICQIVITATIWDSRERTGEAEGGIKVSALEGVFLEIGN